MNATRPCWWQVNIGPDNGLVPSGKKPLPVPVLTLFYVSICVTRLQWVKIQVSIAVYNRFRFIECTELAHICHTVWLGKDYYGHTTAKSIPWLLVTWRRTCKFLFSMNFKYIHILFNFLEGRKAGRLFQYVPRSGDLLPTPPPAQNSISKPKSLRLMLTEIKRYRVLKTVRSVRALTARSICLCGPSTREKVKWNGLFWIVGRPSLSMVRLWKTAVDNYWNKLFMGPGLYISKIWNDRTSDCEEIF